MGYLWSVNMTDYRAWISSCCCLCILLRDQSQYCAAYCMPNQVHTTRVLPWLVETDPVKLFTRLTKYRLLGARGQTLIGLISLDWLLGALIGVADYVKSKIITTVLKSRPYYFSIQTTGKTGFCISWFLPQISAVGAPFLPEPLMIVFDHI